MTVSIKIPTNNMRNLFVGGWTFFTIFKGGHYFLTFFIFSTLASSAFANVVLNPGFEGGFTNWTTYGPNTYIQNGISHTGVNSFKAFGSFIAATNFACVYQDNVSAPGAIYSGQWLDQFVVQRRDQRRGSSLAGSQLSGFIL